MPTNPNRRRPHQSGFIPSERPHAPGRWARRLGTGACLVAVIAGISGCASRDGAATGGDDFTIREPDSAEEARLRAALREFWPGGVPNDVREAGLIQEVVGDWNDLDASIDIAASQREMAVEYAGPTSHPLPLSENDAVRYFHLRTIRDEGVWLVVFAARPGSQTVGTAQTPRANAEDDVRTCVLRVGLLGDPARERALMHAFRKRLGALHGVDTAPID